MKDYRLLKETDGGVEITKWERTFLLWGGFWPKATQHPINLACETFLPHVLSEVQYIRLVSIVSNRSAVVFTRLSF
jgi:hypothetical protein